MEYPVKEFIIVLFNCVLGKFVHIKTIILNSRDNGYTFLLFCQCAGKHGEEMFDLILCLCCLPVREIYFSPRRLLIRLHVSAGSFI